MVSLPEIVRYSDEYLRIAEIDDYPNALNGLQIENSGMVDKIGAAVDASSATLQAAAERHISFLFVHHGMFWPGLRPVTGLLHRQLRLALGNEIALYAAHLPLDLHPEFRTRLLEPRRSLTVNFPVRLDSGEVRSFTLTTATKQRSCLPMWTRYHRESGKMIYWDIRTTNSYPRKKNPLLWAKKSEMRLSF